MSGRVSCLNVREVGERIQRAQALLWTYGWDLASATGAGAESLPPRIDGELRWTLTA